MRGSRHVVRYQLLIVVLATMAMVAGLGRSTPAQSGERAGVRRHADEPVDRVLGGVARQLLNSVPISNLAAGERIVGIDFRPANNRLYGLGSTGQLYLINEITGAGIRIGTPITPALTGTEFGFDFNPTVDRIRVVSDTGQNLRLHPDTGAVVSVDGSLAYAAGDANAGRTPGVSGAAYTNPDNDPATGTTLFDIDTALDVVAVQNPPNDGTLNTLVPLGLDAASVGFDIGFSGFYASIQAAGATGSVLVQMSGPTRTTQGIIGGGEIVPSIAVSLGAPFSPPAERVFVVNGAGELISFDANSATTHPVARRHQRPQRERADRRHRLPPAQQPAVRPRQQQSALHHRRAHRRRITRRTAVDDDAFRHRVRLRFQPDRRSHSRGQQYRAEHPAPPGDRRGRRR